MMPASRLRSVRQKLLLIVLLANFAALVAAGGILLYHDLAQHRANAVTTLTTLAGILGQGSATALEFSDAEVANENLAQLSANPNIVTAAMYTTSGKLFAAYGPARENVGNAPFTPGADNFVFEDGELTVFREIATSHGVVGGLYLKERFDLTGWLIDYLIVLGLILVISLALGLAISTRLQSWISGPIQTVSTLARQVMETRSYHLRATKSTEDEIGQLADSFNGMLDTLEHEIAERSTAEQEVRQLNSELEQRVIERTAELQIANQRLISRTDDAEAANRAKADFLANMSHEIRTPMNAILGLAYLLDQGNLDENASDLVKKIRNAGRSLQSIINDILDLSKIEAGRLEMENAPFHIADMLDNLANIMAANVGNKDIALVISPPPDIGGQLVGDALRLEQVLINLTSNAIKFTDEGSVAVDISLVGQDKKNVTLRFSVKDTGIGIPSEHQARIFDAFSQADISTTRRFGGTGLGLTICRHLVTQMGGEIGVSSELGRGSEFWFTVPFEWRRSEEYEPSKLAMLEVLIIGNNETTGKNLSRIVQSLGWIPTKAESVDIAIQKTRAKMANLGEFDLILMDWKISGSNGLEAATAMRKVLKQDSPPIVLIMSAFSRDELPKLSGLSFINGILSQPVTASALYNIVTEVLGTREVDDITAPVATVKNKGQRIAGVRVLVVDDSEINREVAMRILMTEGALVTLADEGKAAVDWIMLNPDAVDVVLMDVQMPVMDGYEATRLLRAQPQSADLPIIALTAGAFKAQINAAKDAGMDAFVAKPFNVDELMAAIQEHTQGGINTTAEVSEEIPPVELAVPANRHPGLAVDKGMELWGDLVTYRKFLLKFAADYAEAGTRLISFFAVQDQKAAKALTHKIKGAAGNLALIELAASAAVLETSTDTQRDEALRQFISALDTALASIKSFAGQEASSNALHLSTTELDVTPLLFELLQALDTDNPDQANQLLDKFADLIPNDVIRLVRDCVDNFDFRGAEVLVHQLINRQG